MSIEFCRQDCSDCPVPLYRHLLAKQASICGEQDLLFYYRSPSMVSLIMSGLARIEELSREGRISKSEYAERRNHFESRRADLLDNIDVSNTIQKQYASLPDQTRLKASCDGAFDNPFSGTLHCGSLVLPEDMRQESAIPTETTIQ